MNYLAHLFLSDPEPLAWSGSLMGDFVKGRISPSLPRQLSKHLRLHRRIDTYTQQSSAFQSSRKRIDPRFRYARSVLVDVFYDHLLAKHWLRFSDTSLFDYSQQVYQGLQLCFEHLPPPLQQVLPRMIEHNWLYSYRRAEVVERVLWRLEERLRHRFPLAEGYQELEQLQAGLEKDFFAFMDAIVPLVAVWKTEL